jgi:2-amino-4-hydroxy-6-hydroxymethyldihydropteridine diphosphokinase
MSRVVLSIGSNLGDRVARLQSVVDALGERPR